MAARFGFTMLARLPKDSAIVLRTWQRIAYIARPRFVLLDFLSNFICLRGIQV